MDADKVGPHIKNPEIKVINKPMFKHLVLDDNYNRDDSIVYLA